MFGLDEFAFETDGDVLHRVVKTKFSCASTADHE